MKKPLVLKCLFVVFVAIFMVAWMGSAFGDEDSDALGLPDCQPAAFLTELTLLQALPEFAGYYKNARPLMGESFACYIEMHEKSPPASVLI